MTHSEKCVTVAQYIANNMNYPELVDFVVATLCDEMWDSITLKEYMADYGLTEQNLEELGGE